MVQYKRGRKTPWLAQVRDFQGNLRAKSFSTKTMAEDYERLQGDRRRAIRAGVRAPLEQSLFLDYTAGWLRKRERTNPKSTTEGEDSKLRNVWVPYLGKLPLEYVTTELVIEKLDELQAPEDGSRGISGGTRNRHRALLHTIFNAAILAGKVTVNPISRVPLVPEKPVRKKTVIRDADRLEVYLAKVYERTAAYGLLVEIMLFTGCRVSEAIGLQYGDLDLAIGTITFRRIEERAGGSKIVERIKGDGDTSGEDGGLTIPLFPRLRQKIQAHRIKSGFKRDTDFICARADGSYTRYDAFKVANKGALAAAGLPLNATPHTLRASFATLLKKAGYTRAELREFLGHSSEAVTARYDKKDVQHLIDRGKQLGFGAAQKLRRVK